MKYLQKTFLLLLTNYPTLMLAAGSGGLEEEATSILSIVRAAIISIIGIATTIALTWQFSQALMGRKSWAAVLEAALCLLGANAVILIVAWLFAILN